VSWKALQAFFTYWSPGHRLQTWHAASASAVQLDFMKLPAGHVALQLAQTVSWISEQFSSTYCVWASHSWQAWHSMFASAVQLDFMKSPAGQDALQAAQTESANGEHGAASYSPAPHFVQA
jgi:hypothetical protein